MTRLGRVLGRGILLLVLAPAPVLAQNAVVRVRENFRARANGEVIAVLEPGAAVARAPAREEAAPGWLEVDVEGWVWLQSLQATGAAGYDLVVAPEDGENLRARPSGAIVGRLARGTLLHEQERVPGWVRVRRRGWIWAASVDTARAATTAGPAPSAARPAPAAGDPAPRALPADRHAAAILSGPAGDTLARVLPGAQLQVLAREGSWARVRVEGWAWMPPGDSAADLAPVDATPAQLADDPERYRGRVVSWELQFLSLERAERIRTEFFEGEPFLLTRHAAGGYVYVAIPPDGLAQTANLLPLERIRVVGRVRSPASALTGSPIVDLMEMERVRDRR